MKPLVIANWKMHPATARAALRLAGAIESVVPRRGVEVVLAPPFPYLPLLKSSGHGFALGAQDAFWEASGAYTGEVSSAMLKHMGVRYVILGHSERRRYLGETDAMVNRKVRAALKAGVVPVVAVGEGAAESQAVVPRLIAEELTQAVAGVARRSLSGAVIAYEPVWAISTTPGAAAATPDHATRRAIYIRKVLLKLLGVRVAETVRVIYGGSVSARNAAAFISRDIRGMEGLLVGSASLDADEFVGILCAVAGRSHPLRPRQPVPRDQSFLVE